MNTTTELIQELDLGLVAIDQKELSTINKCSEKIKLCQDLTKKLRKKYFECAPSSESEQIKFFKETKPRLISELHFQMELHNYLKGKPKGSAKIKKQHINLCMDKASSFISRHCEFNHYIQLGATHLDVQYFTHRVYDLKFHGHLEHPVDSDYSSPADPTLSCLLAANRFVQFLKIEYFTLKNPNLDPTWENIKSLRWKKSKIDLVELIYSLHAAEAVNGDLKDIMEIFEKLFNIELGNFYRTYCDIKLKKDPVSFVSTLKNSLLEKMAKEIQ